MKQGMSNCENELKASQKIESCCPRGTRLRSDVSYFYYQKEKEKKKKTDRMERRGKRQEMGTEGKVRR